jgi:peptidoglycan/LPS O-acetylase OafA/YrhL
MADRLVDAPRSGYLPTLDGWRAIAILAVILDHMAGRLQAAHPTMFALTRVGPNGVSLFFAISGFLICSRLLEEQNLTGRINLGGFYIRRAFRILPPALIYLVVVGILGLAGFILVSPLEWWSSIFFFRNYLSLSMISRGWGGYTIHYWSLAVEEHFYLLWPALLVLSGRRGARYIACGLAGLVSAWRWWDFHHHWSDKHLPGLLFGSRTDVRLDGLLMGCVAALILINPEARAWVQKHVTFWMWWIGVAIYAGIQIVSRHHAYSIWESILLAFLVATTTVRSETWIGHLLEHPILRWIGRLSYGLYLWEELFALSDAKYPISLLQRAPWNILWLFVVASLSYKFIERPMIQLGHRLAAPPTPGRQDIDAPQLPIHALVEDGKAQVRV